MNEKPFGIDVSVHNGLINWDAVAANHEPVRFAGIRATVSYAYVDGWFKHNWTEAKRFGILRAAYAVVYPLAAALPQMDNFFSQMGADFGELPPVLDIELDQGKSAGIITNVILGCAEIIRARTGRQPILYSRANWVDSFISKGTPPAWLNDFDWWLAQYLKTPDEHPGPPDLPKGVRRERCIIHQTADHTPAFGMQSAMLDYDRWQLTLEELESYGKKTVELSLAEKVERLWAAHPELHLNSGAPT